MSEQNDIFKQIDEAFEDVVKVFSIEIDGDIFRIASMEEIPTEKMVAYLTNGDDARAKFKDMLDMILLCLIDPTDIMKIQQMQMKKMMEFVSDWVQQSSDSAMGDGEEIE